MLNLPKHSRVLLLQGPVGPFFLDLARDLRRQGAMVTKINFNGGDACFFPFGLPYKGKMDGIPAFVEDIVRKKAITTIILFGDCRPVHEGMHEIARRHNLDLRVFEEGYVRPNYITCEKFGVNGYSSLPRSPNFYRALQDDLEPAFEVVGNSYGRMALWAMIYYAAASAMRLWFPSYEHHRPLTIFEGLPWLRSIWRKLRYKFSERKMQSWLCWEQQDPYFLVPLQVHNDTQVTVHSKYEKVEEFIFEVLKSFAAHAPKKSRLVFKHHPMDRAYTDYTQIIHARAKALGVADLVHYIHDQHLPTLLSRAAGAVVINSTVGISAIHQSVPTKVMGDAFYDFEGLTFQGDLDAFWKSAKSFSVDKHLYARFRTYLIRTTQINGSFYRKLRSRRKTHFTHLPLATQEN